jgi:hypothetical protein
MNDHDNLNARAEWSAAAELNGSAELNGPAEPDDCAVLSAVRDSLSGWPVPVAPRLEAITARGRARRRRRLGGLAVAAASTCAAAGACATLAVGLTGGGGPAAPASRQPAPPVQLAAFSVVTRPDGDTTLTLYPGQVANPDAVRRALAQHGIPALVTAGRFCRTAEQPAPGVGQVVVLPPEHPRLTPGHRPSGPGPGLIVIHGSAIPRGVKLSIGYRQGSGEKEISFSLIQAGAPLTCASLPDNGPHSR